MEHDAATWKEMKGWSEQAREMREGQKEGEDGDEIKSQRSAERQ